MKPIAVIAHVDHEGPGYLATILDRQAIPYQLISIGRGDAVPKRADAWSGIVSMGGPMSVNDPLPWVEDECALIRTAVDAGIPVLGHCLGAQMMAKALGGVVTVNPIREIGWFDVEITASETVAPWLRVIPNRFKAFHWHGETFSIPPGATRLLENANCRNQAFVVGNSLALQCHVEMTEDLIRDWINRSPHEFAAPVPGVQSPEEIVRDLPARVRELQRVADAMYQCWLDGVARK